MFLVHTAQIHAQLLARAVIAACRGDGWQTDLQPQLLHNLLNLVLQQDLDIERLEPASRAEVTAALTSQEERLELIQLMCAMEILCNPVPAAMEAEVEDWAEALDVEEPTLLFLRDLALGQVAQAQHDFYRLNWIGDLDHRQPEFAALLERWGEPARATRMPISARHWRIWRQPAWRRTPLSSTTRITVVSCLAASDFSLTVVRTAP